MKSISTIFILVVIFALAATSIAQSDWTKYPGNPVMVKGSAGSWDDLNVGLACVILVGDTYHMWYDANWDDPGITNTGIGHATSFDGIEWQKDVANPVFLPEPKNGWESHTITQTSVLFNDLDSLFYMWYAGYGPGDDDTGIGRAISPDGTNWTRDTLHNPVLSRGSSGSWDDILLLAPCVIRIDGIYHMWYDGWQDGSSVHQIGHATSVDGIAWQRDPANPVFTRGNSSDWDFPEVRGAKVIYDGSRFHMFYTGGRWATYDIGYAYSQDGINWTKYSGNPILTKGPTNSWDDYGLIFASVMFNQTGDSLKMWYSGASNGASTYKIGYATAQIPLYVPGDFETIQAAIDAAHDGNIVLVDEGTYYENINFKGKAITVASHYFMDGDTSHISKTIIDGSKNTDPDSGSVVYFVSGEDTTSVLCGFTITGGSGTYVDQGYIGYSGGGIMMLKGGKVVHNKITGNNLVSQKFCVGAGITVFPYNRSANIVIEHNDIIYNSIISPSLSGGGGLQLVFRWWTGGYCRLKNNVISHNSVTCTGTYKTVAGGVILSLPLPTLGTVIIGDNVVSHNELHCVASIGAGIYVVYFEPGGTVYDYNPCPLIYNNIVTNNYSQDKGGGLGVWTVESGHSSSSVISPQPAFINNTIVNNSAKDGCGIFNYDSYPLLLNNIFWNDLSESGSREIFNDDIDYPEYQDHKNNGIISMYYSDIQGGWEGEGNKDVYPVFADTSNNDFSLTESSPCVGSGADSVFAEDTWYRCPVSDYFSNQRPNPIDDYVDMGAIESPYLITGIAVDKILVPGQFALHQNYPNPFNPITNIEYRIPNSEFVTLKIYNLLGQKIVTLVSERQKPGHHQVEWNAGDLSSGVYYYMINAGGFHDVKKMILLR